ncbi:NACHT domain-containing protein [Streptomyces sp. HSW2009]|uniref:NACHT domain-containing protein n=1 Tax=Streptomyces sp. HSW2009 TaxID=3142890 RepID=UPI0032ED6CE4
MIAIEALGRPFDGGDPELARTYAAMLAHEVKRIEEPVQRQLLGADNRRINLAYALHPTAGRGAVAPPAGRTFAEETATLPDILEYYRATRPRRLVITGAAGAGKTVLALELMLALIEGRAEDDPVPVRVSLTQWRPGQSLTALLVQQLVEACNMSRGKAVGLVERGMVLPILDGLDEMDPLREDGTPDPEAPRGRAVLEALNAYQDGRDAGPLVLTCRTSHYNAFGPTSRLIDAARVAIAPVDTRHAIEYLNSRARDVSRWQPLVNYLQENPQSALAAILSTPWRLTLVATVYHRDGRPAELLDLPTGRHLDQYLLARYIPAATANSPNPRRYQAEDIHRWLHRLTRQMDGATLGAPATDIALHRLWPLAGVFRVRVADVLLTSLLVIPTFFLLLAADDLAFTFIDPTSATSSGSDLKYEEEGVSFASEEDGARGDIFLEFGNAYGSRWFYVYAVVIGLLAHRSKVQPRRFQFLRPNFWSRLRGGFKVWFVVGLLAGFCVMWSMEWGLSSHFDDSSADAMDGGLLFSAIGSGIAIGVVVGGVGGLLAGLGEGFARGFKVWFIACFVLVFLLFSPIPFMHGWLLLSIPLAGALLSGILGGLAGALSRGLKGDPVATYNPRSVIRGDAIQGILSCFVIALYAVSVVEVFGGLVDIGRLFPSGHSEGPGADFSFSAGPLVGAAVGLVNGFAVAARRYGLFLLLSHGKLPFRLAHFLDWAVTAGLLRYNGPAYQFRHRELQQWLAQYSAPG